MSLRGDASLARKLSHGPVAQILATGGQLRWRILMVLILLGSIAVPLRRALLQVANEAVTRTAVQEALKRLAPPEAIVSQQVSVGRNDIIIRLISTRRISESKVGEIRDDLMRRTGHEVQVSVEAVASKTELADLMARLTTPAPEPPPPEKSVSDLQKELLDKVRPALDAIWPSSDAPIQGFTVMLSPLGLAIDVQYQSAADLGEVPIGMVRQNLREKFGMPNLTLTATRIQAPSSTTRSGRTPSKPRR